MENLRITTVQSHLRWEDIPANLAIFDEKLDGLANKADLVILPEMFTTGFSMNPSTIAENMDGQTIGWLRQKAKSLDAVVTGSFVAKDQGHFYNRLVWMQPDGHFEYYDKRHLFTLAGEHKAYTPGQKKLVVEWKGWKICPMICYDLRFPVWSRNVEGYDLLVYVANWPETRSHHWKHLLMARAIENQSYVAGVNRVGSDALGLKFTGDTSVVDFSGMVIHQVSGEESVFTCEISKAEIDGFRNKLDFLSDQDNFKILP